MAVFIGTFENKVDRKGRVSVPAQFRQILAGHAGISERAAFVGKGPIFQIWEPVALERHKEEARARARSQGLTLPLRPNQGDGR